MVWEQKWLAVSFRKARWSSQARTFPAPRERKATRRQPQVLVVVHRVWVAPVEEEGNQLLGAATSPRWWAAFDAAN